MYFVFGNGTFYTTHAKLITQSAFLILNHSGLDLRIFVFLQITMPIMIV